MLKIALRQANFICLPILSTFDSSVCICHSPRGRESEWEAGREREGLGGEGGGKGGNLAGAAGGGTSACTSKRLATFESTSAY